jgi:hypothetical protein
MTFYEGMLAGFTYKFPSPPGSFMLSGNSAYGKKL